MTIGAPSRTLAVATTPRRGSSLNANALIASAGLHRCGNPALVERKVRSFLFADQRTPSSIELPTGLGEQLRVVVRIAVAQEPDRFSLCRGLFAQFPQAMEQAE